MLDACGPMCEYRGTLKKPGVLMHLFEELSRALWQRRKTNGCCGGLSSTVGSSVATDAQIEAEA